MSTDLPPLAPPPPAATGAPASSARSAPSGLARIGLLIAAAGGIVSAFAAKRVAVSGESVFGPSTVSLDTQIAVIGGILAAVLIAAAFIPGVWARVVGAVVALGLAGFLALAAIGARTDDIFTAGTSVSAESGLWLMGIGALLAVVGGIVAMIGIAPPPSGRGAGAGMGAGALVLGIVALVIAPVGAVAAWMGRVAGGGLGWAGWVLGWLGVLGWAIGLAIGIPASGP